MSVITRAKLPWMVGTGSETAKLYFTWVWMLALTLTGWGHSFILCPMICGRRKTFFKVSGCFLTSLMWFQWLWECNTISGCCLLGMTIITGVGEKRGESYGKWGVDCNLSSLLTTSSCCSSRCIIDFRLLLLIEFPTIMSPRFSGAKLSLFFISTIAPAAGFRMDY